MNEARTDQAETSEAVVAYVTYPDAEEARRAARLVVEERLAACVHIRPHESVYRWRGKVEEAAEIGLLIKTTRRAYPALEARLRALHSYELPAIVAWDVSAGSPAYLEWVAAETQG